MAERADQEMKPNHQLLIEEIDKLGLVGWHLLRLIDLEDRKDEDAVMRNKLNSPSLSKRIVLLVSVQVFDWISSDHF